MDVPYDILKRNNDGSVRWVDAVRDLNDARERIAQLVRRSPGDYCVFDQNRQTMIPMIYSEGADPDK
jgi:hypothetical protein